MPKKASVARLFTTGRSQAVRLPKEFRFEGDAVRIRHLDGGVLLEPIETNVERMFAKIDAIDVIFMPDGRNQPVAPVEQLFP